MIDMTLANGGGAYREVYHWELLHSRHSLPETLLIYEITHSG